MPSAARAAVLPLAVLAVAVLLAAALTLAAQAGLFAGGTRLQAGRILPAPAPNAVPFTGPLPSYQPAAARG